MTLIYSLRFEEEALVTYTFIAQDKPKAAKEFLSQLKQRIEGLVDNPKICRQNDEGYRELIYKGYTVPYLLDGDNIIILGLFNQNSWVSDLPTI